MAEKKQKQKAEKVDYRESAAQVAARFAYKWGVSDREALLRLAVAGAARYDASAKHYKLHRAAGGTPKKGVRKAVKK